MPDEYWATFSIYDHRQSLYRRTLVLFDRVVMPVPTEPVGNLTQAEIEILAADADYLEREGAAIRFDWDRNEFYEWQRETVGRPSVDSEALAVTLANDPPLATRLQLSDRYRNIASHLLPQGVTSVTALPAYGSLERYHSAIQGLKHDVQEQKVIEIVIKQLPVPDSDAPLEDIIWLRNTRQFRRSMEKLRSWQFNTVTALLTDQSDRAFQAAEHDFQRWVTDYRSAMDAAKFKRVEAGLVSLLTLGGIIATGAQPLLAQLAQVVPALLMVRDVVQPVWKQVEASECAPAGVVYTAAQVE